MTRFSRYSEAFWGPDFTSTAGFEALSRRMREGKALCKEFEEYLNKRYKMEASYCKDLLQLQKSMKHKDEIGVLEKAWNKLKDELEKMVSIHHEAGSHFQKQAEEVKRFNDAQTSKKRATEEQVKKYQSNKNSLYHKCLTNHKTYKEKCRDKDNATDNYNAHKTSVTTLAKDLEKATKQKFKAEEDAQKADVMYKSSLDTLESSRISWEKEMHDACDIFQSIDEERIRFLRECLWISTNIDSQAAVDIDDSCEAVRLVLEKCEVSQDLCTFIQRYQTGSSRPAKVEYENYYANGDTHSGSPGRKNRAPQPTGNVPTRHRAPVQPSPRNLTGPPPNGYNAHDDTYATVDER